MNILDTNVVSELMRPRPSPRVLGWIAEQRNAELFTTSITEAEVYYGVELLAEGKRRQALFAAAESLFSLDFAGRILGFESEAARAFAKIVAKRRSAGKPIGLADAEIAAIASVYSALLVTRDVADFAGCGIEVFNPWAPY